MRRRDHDHGRCSKLTVVVAALVAAVFVDRRPAVGGQHEQGGGQAGEDAEDQADGHAQGVGAETAGEEPGEQAGGKCYGDDGELFHGLCSLVYGRMLSCCK